MSSRSGRAPSSGEGQNNLALWVILILVILVIFVLLWAIFRQEDTSSPTPPAPSPCEGRPPAPSSVSVAKDTSPSHSWTISWTEVTQATSYEVTVGYEDLVNDTSGTTSANIVTEPSYNFTLDSGSYSEQVRLTVTLVTVDAACGKKSKSKTFVKCSSGDASDIGDVEFDTDFIGPAGAAYQISWDEGDVPDNIWRFAFYRKNGALYASDPAGPDNFDECRIVEARDPANQRFTNLFRGGQFSEVNIAIHGINWCGDVSSMPVDVLDEED